MNAPQKPIQPRHRLLAWARRWHAWGGLLAAIFLVAVGSTGILLNYKKPILSAFGAEPAARLQRTPSAPRNDPADPGTGFSTLTGLGAAGIPAGEALATARKDLGDVPLDRIELKREAGVLAWKIKAIDDREVIVDAKTGASYLKGPYEKAASNGVSGKRDRTTDWGKIALDLHTGKIGGEAGKAVMTAMAAMLVFLSLSGVYLYAKPLLIRRANARVRNGAAHATRREPTGANPPKRVSAALCEESSRS